MQRRTKGGHSMMSNATLLLVLGFCISLSGCDGPNTSWSAESRSPNGKMIARAHTIQPGGMGIGNFGTFVDLNWTTGSQAPTVILAFSDGRDEPGDDTAVAMNWLSPTRLELTYKRHRTIDFEAIKCHGIDISVRDVTGEPASTSK
jgi:hypothetical protein